jgi:hypothetical protein
MFQRISGDTPKTKIIHANKSDFKGKLPQVMMMGELKKRGYIISSLAKAMQKGRKRDATKLKA